MARSQETALKEAALKETALKVGALIETQAELKRHKMTSNELVHKDWSGRHKRHSQKVARKLSQKQVDDIRTSTQSQGDYWHQLTIMDTSYRQRMLQDSISERELRTDAQVHRLELNRTTHSNQERAHQLRQEKHVNEVLEGRSIDRLLSKTAEKERNRKQAHALALAEIENQCRLHRQTSPSTHLPRMAYFKFGATGHAEPKVGKGFVTASPRGKSALAFLPPL